MKKINRFNVCFVIVTIVFINSCSKTDVAQPTPQPTPTPTPPSAAALTITATPATAWYNGSDTINFTSDGSVTVNGNGILAGTSIILNNLIKDTTLVFSAIKKDPVTGLTSTPTIKTVIISVYSLRKTNLIWNSTTNQNNMWILTFSSFQQYPLGNNAVEVNDPVPYFRIIFYVGNKIGNVGDTCHVFTDRANPNSFGRTNYQLADNDQTYIFSTSNISHILQLDSIFKIEATAKAVNDPNDSAHFVRIYSRQ